MFGYQSILSNYKQSKQVVAASLLVVSVYAGVKYIVPLMKNQQYYQNHDASKNNQDETENKLLIAWPTSVESSPEPPIKDDFFCPSYENDSDEILSLFNRRISGQIYIHRTEELDIIKYLISALLKNHKKGMRNGKINPINGVIVYGKKGTGKSTALQRVILHMIDTSRLISAAPEKNSYIPLHDIFMTHPTDNQYNNQIDKLKEIFDTNPKVLTSKHMKIRVIHLQIGKYDVCSCDTYEHAKDQIVNNYNTNITAVLNEDKTYNDKNDTNYNGFVLKTIIYCVVYEAFHCSAAIGNIVSVLSQIAQERENIVIALDVTTPHILRVDMTNANMYAVEVKPERRELVHEMALECHAGMVINCSGDFGLSEEARNRTRLWGKTAMSRQFIKHFPNSQKLWQMTLGYPLYMCNSFVFDAEVKNWRKKWRDCNSYISESIKFAYGMLDGAVVRKEKCCNQIIQDLARNGFIQEIDINKYQMTNPVVIYSAIQCNLYIHWKIERLIWIAFYKNICTHVKSKCFIATLPKDLVHHILSFA